MDALLVVTCVFSALAVVAAATALFVVLRTSGARLEREFRELSADVGLARELAAGVRTEWQAAQVGYQRVVDEAVATLEAAEKRRRKARAERQRADEEGEQQQQQRGCPHGGDPVMCVACATNRFRAEGHPV